VKIDATTMTKTGENTAKEAIEKLIEEEQQKKDVETRSDDSQLMDTNIPKISIVCANRNTPFSGLGLGICTPFIPSEVPILKKITYNKISGRVVQE
jgi:hypothetical protein